MLRQYIVMFPLLVWFTRLVISSSNNKLYSLLYIRELNSHVNECPGGNLIWARMSGVVIWCEHECPGGHLMWARMSGWSFDVSTNVRPCQNSRGNECPWERMSVHHSYYVVFVKEHSYRLTYTEKKQNLSKYIFDIKEHKTISCYCVDHLKVQRQLQGCYSRNVRLIWLYPRKTSKGNLCRHFNRKKWFFQIKDTALNKEAEAEQILQHHTAQIILDYTTQVQVSNFNG